MRFLPLLLLLSACFGFKPKSQKPLELEQIQRIEISKLGLDTFFLLENAEIEEFVAAWNAAEPKGPMKYANIYTLLVITTSGDTLGFRANDSGIINSCELENKYLLDNFWRPAYKQYLNNLPKPKKKKDLSKELCNALPCGDYVKAVAYEIEPRGEGWPEDVFRKRTDKQRILTKSEATEIFDLLNNPLTYGNGIAACHYPRIGIVCYDSLEQPCSYLTLCLECNNLKSKPDFRADYELTMLKGFSKPTRKKLRQIFQKWGLPDNNISEMFD